MAALLELGVYAVAIICLALALIITVVVEALLGWIIAFLNKIPAVNIGTGWLHTVSQAVTSGLGKAFGEVDHIMGASLHLFAEYADKLWHGIEQYGNLLYDLSKLASLIARALHAIEHKVTAGLHGVIGIGKDISALKREWHGIEQRVKALEQDWSKGIGHDLRISVKALEQEYGTIVDTTVPDIRSLARTAEADVTALDKWVKDNALLAGTTALTGAIAWALSQLGLGGLRCNSLLNSLSKRGCGLWSGLEDLLGLLFDAAIFTDLCHVIPTIEGLLGDVEAPIVDLVSAAANAVCAQPPQGWLELTAPTLYGPTTSEITATL